MSLILTFSDENNTKKKILIVAKTFASVYRIVQNLNFKCGTETSGLKPGFKILGGRISSETLQTRDWKTNIFFKQIVLVIANKKSTPKLSAL